jgi:hypothetical protein
MGGGHTKRACVSVATRWEAVVTRRGMRRPHRRPPRPRPPQARPRRPRPPRRPAQLRALRYKTRARTHACARLRGPMARAAAGSARRRAAGLLPPARRARAAAAGHGAKARGAPKQALDNVAQPYTLGRHMSDRLCRATPGAGAAAERAALACRCHAPVRANARQSARRPAPAALRSPQTPCPRSVRSAWAGPAGTARGSVARSGVCCAAACARARNRGAPGWPAECVPGRTIWRCRPCTLWAAPARGATCGSPRTPPTTPTCRRPALRALRRDGAARRRRGVVLIQLSQKF